MPPRRGFSQARGRQSVRRQTAWEEGPGGTAGTVISTPTSVILGSGIQPVADGLTVVRLRGYLEILLEAADVVGSGYAGAVGACVVNSDAFAVGVTAVPNPVDDSDWDGWMYHRFFSLHATTATIGDGVNTGRLAWEVDSKAMRKLPLNETLLMSIQTFEVGAAQIEVFFDSRVLVKLP